MVMRVSFYFQKFSCFMYYIRVENLSDDDEIHIYDVCCLFKNNDNFISNGTFKLTSNID